MQVTSETEKSILKSKATLDMKNIDHALSQYIVPNSPEIKQLLEEKKLFVLPGSSTKLSCFPLDGKMSGCAYINKSKEDISNPKILSGLITDIIHNAIHIDELVNKNLHHSRHQSYENEKTVSQRTVEVLEKIIEVIKDKEPSLAEELKSSILLQQKISLTGKEILR